MAMASCPSWSQGGPLYPPQPSKKAARLEKKDPLKNVVQVLAKTGVPNGNPGLFFAPEAHCGLFFARMARRTFEKRGLGEPTFALRCAKDPCLLTIRRPPQPILHSSAGNRR